MTLTAGPSIGTAPDPTPTTEPAPRHRPTRRRRSAARLVALDPQAGGTLRLVAILAAASGVGRLGAVVLLARAVARLASADPRLGTGTLLAAAGFLLAAAAASAAARLVAHHGSTTAKARLRDRVVAAAAGRGSPVDDRLIGLLTGGLDRLDGFVSAQWPTRARAATVPFVAVTVLAVVDWRAALVGLALLPAAPLLAWVIGARTAAQVRRTWRAAGRLGGTFLDSVAGVMTLKLSGRPDEQAARIEAASEQHRRLTLGVLRTAVLSSTATGLVSTMAVGLVAVFCGTRVVSGDLGLSTALTAILLVPEVYRAPLEAAASFHTEAEVAAVLDDLEAMTAAPAPVTAVAETAVIEDVTVRYPGRAAPALAGVSHRFQPGTVAAIRGPSGSGKSTLLRVLAGTLPASSGWVTRPAGVGYLPQQPQFPQAGTVGDAVRGGHPELSDGEVTEALRAASAGHLLDAGYGGLDRPLESLGASLSTGERRLVGLARAYAAAAHGQLLVLDEPTAHLDPDTEERVLTGLVRRARELRLTVVMAAHRPAALAAADAVVDLRAASAIDPDRYVEQPGEHADQPGAGPEEATDTSGSPIERVGGRWVPAAAVACGVLSALCGLGLTATATALLVRAMDHPPLLSLSLFVVSVRAFAIGRPVLRYCERLLAHDAAFRELTRRRMQVWSLLVPRIPGRGLPARGELLTRIARDADDEVDGTIRGVHAGLVLALTVTTATAGLAVLAPPAAAVAGLGLLAVAGGGWLMDRTVYARRSADQLRRRSARDAAVVDVAVGLDDLAGNGGPTAVAALLRPSGAALDAAGGRLARAEAVTDAAVAGAVGLLPFAALAAVLAADGKPSAAPAAAAVLVVAALAELLSAGPDMTRAIRMRGQSRARRAALAGVPVSQPDPQRSAVAPPNPVLTLEDVSASWGGPGEPVLGELTLALPPGRRVAVTGRSGSGKSTLAAVIAHLLEPTAGRVRLDDVDYRVLSGPAVRRQVAAVGLADHIFADTVRGNLTLGDHRTSEDLVAALDRVRLGSWLASLPGGLDTVLGSGGTTVSGGEARRLALARALLRDPSVLVLDEPVEGLDSPTAQAVLADLSDRDPGLSWLLLAHRPEGIDLVDDVYRLEAGRLAGRAREGAAGPGLR